jgi:site-specific DNA-methyltransferase (adenine-specific)
VGGLGTAHRLRDLARSLSGQSVKVKTRACAIPTGNHRSVSPRSALTHPFAAGSVAAEMRPFAQTPLGQLHCVDAIEHITSLPTASARLVFADPPYNAGRESWDAFESSADYLAWTERWVAQAERVLDEAGSLYICGFSEALADIKAAVGRRFASCRWLVWHYRNKGNLHRDWGRAHESVLHLRKAAFALDVDGARVAYNTHTLRYPSHPQAATSRFGRRTYVWRPHPLGAKPRDVLEIPTLTNGMREKTPHPTQKPVELVRRLIAAATREGDLVIDPFAGSGTVAVACEALGRRWLATELDRHYCTIAAARLRERIDIDETDRAETRRRAQRRKLR